MNFANMKISTRLVLGFGMLALLIALGKRRSSGVGDQAIPDPV